jgi:lysozyme|tara:strand:- start:1906 stop:2340 length:435 start_codon:yes stop_codon:yes gene_type:complete
MSKELLKEEIKLHEGFRDMIYLDSLSKKTIGYGHLIVHEDKFVEGKAYPKEELEALFDKDFEKGWVLMERFCSVNNLNVSEKAQEVLCEMIFQMGYSGVGKFKNMIKALQNNDTKTASIEMLDSRWAKQTPNRAKALSDKMSNA